MVTNKRVQVSIIIPSYTRSGPVLGACALANSLIDEFPTRIISVKGGNGINAHIDERVERMSLTGGCLGFAGWVSSFRKLLGGEQSSRHVNISFCFSADVANYFSGDLAVTVSSVRGNLKENYKYDYGRVGGSVLVAVHLWLLKRFNFVIALNSSMSQWLMEDAEIEAKIIPNFIDERALLFYQGIRSSRQHCRIFVIGSLSARKNVESVIYVMDRLRDLPLTLHLIGSGPKENEIGDLISTLKLRDKVILEGQLVEPAEKLIEASCIVAPSFSEGTSRAVLEALFLGVPCFLRNVDSNSDLCEFGGFVLLFNDEEELALKLRAAFSEGRLGRAHQNLLPKKNRQNYAQMVWINLIKDLF